MIPAYETEVQMDEMICLMTLSRENDRAQTTLSNRKLLHVPLLHMPLLEDVFM